MSEKEKEPCPHFDKLSVLSEDEDYDIEDNFFYIISMNNTIGLAVEKLEDMYTCNGDVSCTIRKVNQMLEELRDHILEIKS